MSYFRPAKWLWLILVAGIGLTGSPARADDGNRQSLDPSATPPSATQIAKIDVVDPAGRPTAVTAMDVSGQSGLICVGTESNQLQLIDVQSRQTVATSKAHRDRIRSVCFSPNGKQIVSVGNDGRLITWKISTGRVDPTTRQRGDLDGIQVSSSAVRLEPIQTIDQTPALAKAAFSPNAGNIVAVGFTKQIYVLGRNGNPSGRLACSHMDLRALTYDDAGRLIVAGRGGAVHVYQRDEMTPVQVGTAPRPLVKDDFTICRCQTNPGSINDITRLPSDGRIVCVCDEGIVSQYDSVGNEVDGRIKIGKGRLFAVAAIDSNTVAVAGSDDLIRLIDLSSRRVTGTLAGHRGSVVDLAIIDGQLISAGFDATIRFWQTPTSTHGVTREPKVAIKPPSASPPHSSALHSGALHSGAARPSSPRPRNNEVPKP